MSGEPTSFFGYFKDIVTLLTPIIIAYFSYRSVKKEKLDKENQILREKYEKEMEEKRNAIEKKRDQDIKDIKDDVDILKQQVEQLEGVVNMDEINRSLNKLVDISSINMEYSQSLSHVVVTIGEALKESSTVEANNISKAIETHQSNERNLTNKIYKALY